MNPRVFFHNPSRDRTRARTAKQEERLWSLAMKNPRCINYRRQHVHKTRNGNKFAVTREERCQSFSRESMSAVLHLEIAKIYCDSLFFKGRSDIKRSERRLRLPILPQRCGAEGDAGDR